MFLLVGDKFMPEINLRQPRLLFSTCGTSAKNKEGIQKFKETGDLRYIYSGLDKVCLHCAYKDLPKRTPSDKVLCNKAFGIASNPQYDAY